MEAFRRFGRLVSGQTGPEGEGIAPPSSAVTEGRGALVCSWCGLSPSPYTCSQCDQEPYCSKLCQSTHWPTHRAHCRAPVRRTDQESINALLYHAAGRGDLNAVSMLIAIEGADSNWIEPIQGVSVLYIASQFGHEPVVKKLIANGAHVNFCKKADGATSLMIASQQGQIGVVRCLLKAGAVVNFPRPGLGGTALSVASLRGCVEIVSLLIIAGADVHYSRPLDGATFLQIAAESGQLEVIRILLAAGAKVNAARSSDGTTALTIASQNGHIDVVKELLESGADPRISLKNGFTALNAAKKFNHPEIAQLLEDRLARIVESHHR